ncbi:MAG: SAM hydrolase/SAM-dependent halogenase family protein [Acidimicrobiales bacterium]
MSTAKGAGTRAARPPRVISLLSDYGLADGFVGALHCVIRARLPTAPIVDITHEVAPCDIRAGSLALLRAAPYLPSGVVLAVVDPGVATPRRGVAVQAAGADMFFVGPDNGLLPPAVDALGGPRLVVELQDRGYWSLAPGPTFAGRDIFAPAAALLAAGSDPLQLGAPVDAVDLVRLPPPQVGKRLDGSCQAEVTWVDHFGNVQLAARPADLPSRPLVAVELVGQPQVGPGGGRVARFVQAFAELEPGELGVLVDSYGQLALVLDNADAAASLNAHERDVVVLRPLGQRERVP